MTKPTYALGLGCERGCDPQEVFSLAERVLKEARVVADDLLGVFSIDQRKDEPAIVRTAEHFSLPVTCFSAQVLEKETPRLLNPSERVFTLIGCHGVAEAAALAAVGSDGILVIGKMKSAHATAALAVKR
jgi:cobalt-precorrin 5A hydrolase